MAYTPGVARVSTYRYPDPSPAMLGIPLRLDGPEQVFRVRIGRPVANFGVAVLSHAPGASVQPRIVAAGDENRLIGFTALPLDLNPYLATYGAADPSSGAVLPARGTYDVVFDTPSKSWIAPRSPLTCGMRITIRSPTCSRSLYDDFGEKSTTDSTSS